MSPEVLSELVAKITTDAAGLKSGLSEGEKATEQSSKKMADSLKKVGMAMAASGAAITAALGFMGKAAIDERVNIKRLEVALKGVGISYDNVKDSLEAVIAATQRKTGIADNDQRDVLGRLILVTKDYHKALDLLPLTLDLAAAGQMDATTAATYLAKAYEELEGGAEEIGIRLGQATVKFKNLDEVQRLVGGSAEETANPFNVLKATIGDVAESIGSFLIPSIEDLVNRFGAVSDGIQNWIKLNPKLVEQIVLSTAKLGLLLLTIGSLIIILPKIVGFITMLTGLMGPWGWAVLAVSVIVGFLVAELLGLSDVMVGMKDIMADVQKQMFILRAEQALSTEEWAKIKEQGYLTEKQFISLAEAMKLSTKELYDQMVASGMLQQTMSTLGDTNTYLATKAKETSAEMDDLKTVLDNVTKASKNVNLEMEATKQSIARATWEADGYTYSMSLFTQAEIDAAKASGKKVEELKKQFETTEDNINKAKDYTLAIKDTSTSVSDLSNALADLSAQEEMKGKIALAGQAGAIHPEALPELEAAWAKVKAALDAGNIDEYFRLSKELLKPLQEKVWGFASGGIVPGAIGQPQLVMVHGGETIIPGFQKGGIVPGPIGMPQLAMVHGGETIVPPDDWGGTVNIYIDSFTANSARDVDMLAEKIVKLIRVRTGLK